MPSIAPSRACAWFGNKRFDWPSVSFFDHWPIRMLGFVSLFCTELTLFCIVFEKNSTALNQSKWRNFFMYIIIVVIMFLKIVLASWLLEGEGTLKSLDSVLIWPHFGYLYCVPCHCVMVPFSYQLSVLTCQARITILGEQIRTVAYLLANCSLLLIITSISYVFPLIKMQTSFNSLWSWEMTPSLFKQAQL